MKIKSIYLALLIFISFVFCGHELLTYDPKANSQAVVTSGNARFTILTDRLIRMEYSKNGKFVDQATVAFLNRNLPVPQFDQKQSNGELVISTEFLELHYIIGTLFSPNTLSIKHTKSTPPFNWTYGLNNPKQQLGTIRTLDTLSVISLNCSQIKDIKVHDEYLHCEMGLMSRDGWTVFDDSQNWLLNEEDWWDRPNTDDVDNYFFGFGYDYYGALLDFTKVSGKTAMVPKYSTGIWWSRWLNINNHDVHRFVNDYESRDIPLDVYVLDMDWHTKQGWGTYSFDKRLFPIPASIMEYLHHKGLHSTINLHDDDGVGPYDTMYKEMAKALGLDPNSQKQINFNIVNSSYMYALEDIVLKNLMDQGVDFFWIDWQQGGTQGGAAGKAQNPTIWLNHLRGTDHIRNNNSTRDLILARYGGLGSQRYQVGFSGDVNGLTWQNFAFQPYFSLTASNVGFGFWSHDLLGPHDDHELHSRWLQFGSFSGIFRTHDRGMSTGSCWNKNPPDCAIVEVWNVPQKYMEVNRNAMRKREHLIPYIYNATRTAFDEGISLLRPMYYDFPTFDFAYKSDPQGNWAQYMFGPHIMVAPVTQKSDNTSMAKKSVWIPPGKWIEEGTGVILEGKQDGTTVLEKYFDLREIPIFYKGGSIIPQIPIGENVLGLARQQYTSLIFSIYPGTSSGSTSFYEDDGQTTDYLQGKYGYINVSYTRTSTQVNIQIQSTGNGYPERPKERDYEIRLVNFLAISSATVNGQSLKYSRFGGQNTFNFNGEEMTASVFTSSLDTNSVIKIAIQTSQPVVEEQLSGIKGGIIHSNWAKENLDLTGETPGANTVTSGVISDVASSGDLLGYYGNDISNFMKVLGDFRSKFQQGQTEVSALIPPGPRALVQLYDANRKDNCLCGTEACRSANSDPSYQFMRVEGYGPDPKEPGIEPFNIFWNQAITDNWSTTAASVSREGYVKGVFDNGFVYKVQNSNTVPLQLWYSESRKDMLTVASQSGILYAKDNGYQLLNSTLGYVLTKAPRRFEGVNDERILYSETLLQTAFN